jgi:hypothetical protein
LLIPLIHRPQAQCLRPGQQKLSHSSSKAVKKGKVMKRIAIANLLATVLACGPASAWSHAGGYRGGASHNDFGGSSAHAEGYGGTHTNAAGGNTTHVDGEGTTHTSAYGTSSTHYQGADGGYSTHTNQYGDTTTGKAGYGAVTTTPGGAAAYHPPTTYAAGYHPPAGAYPDGAYAYHPPTVVNSYSAGCYNCGGWSAGAAAVTGAAVGMAAGVATGAAIASANSSAAAANAYSAGVVAGAASATYAMGQIVAVIPSGCATPNVQGQAYYLCGNTWFSPSYGANGVYYRVVAAP